jgi:hypothetical protein
MFSLLLNYFIGTPCLAIAMSQGGDFIGGSQKGNWPCLRRKCMNTIICAIDRPFEFFGRINEDVNTYVTLGRRGHLFFTVLPVKILQLITQSNAGGMAELYLDSGTYLKTFYSVMYSPSCVKVGTMGDPRGGQVRIHHKINWHHCAPKILREEWSKP